MPWEQLTEGSDGPKEDEMKKKPIGSTILPHRYALSVCGEDGHDSLHVDRRIGEKKSLVTVEEGAAVTVAALPKGEPSTKFALQTASEDLVRAVVNCREYELAIALVACNLQSNKSDYTSELRL
jgi:hypothetical protein